MIWMPRPPLFATLAALAMAAGFIGASAGLYAAPHHASLPETDFAFPAFAARDALPGPYRASVLRVIDGDTFEARLRVWFGQDVTVAVRIRGFDAPELKSKCQRDMVLAQEARAALADLLASGPLVLREIGRDKYGGRVVASVEIATNARGQSARDDVAVLMIAGGYGRPYDGRARAACAS
jgi:micrococcal nuclease